MNRNISLWSEVFH